MRILVIDDSAANLAQAKEQLQGHELTLVSTYDAARKVLEVTFDNSDQGPARTKYRQLLAEAGYPGKFDEYSSDKIGTEKYQAYRQTSKALFDQCVGEFKCYPQFDAVLSDLMLPASEKTLGPKGYQHIGKEMPLGTFLLLLAMRARVKKVGLVTDTNHHDHPASAAVDAFGCGRDGAFDVGDTKVVCWNYGKDWKEVLGLLNGEKPE